jgi:hypothetical protein
MPRVHTILFLCLSVLATNARAADDLAAAREFQREVEIAPAPELLPDLTRHLREELSLPMGKVLDQGHSMWCWAFSAFHTLRAYYQNVPSTGSDFDAWKEAIGKLDQQKSFTHFLGGHVSSGQTGEPMRFIRMFREENSLSDDTWTALMPGDGRWTLSPERGPDIDMSQVKHLSREEIVKHIKASLEKGSPSAYCANPHCITIYGGSYEGDEPTEYYIADSIGGRTYHADARRMNARLEYIATRDSN